jgi:hypothetical protein
MLPCNPSPGKNPLGDLQPAGVHLLAQVTAILEKFGDFFLAGAGGKLASGANQPFRLDLGVCDSHAKDLEQLSGIVVHGFPPSSRT